MSDAAPYEAMLQCNLLEVFCDALDAAILVTDKLDTVSFASLRLLHHFPVPEGAIAPGTRARDLYSALFDAGCRFGYAGGLRDKKREDWIAERVATSWRERTDTIEPSGPDRWFRVVSRRFPSGLGITVFHDVTEHKKKEITWRIERERVRMTEQILDTLPVAIAIKDRELNYVAVNQQYCRMMNASAESIIGKNIWDVLEPGLAATMEKSDWQLLASGEGREMIFTLEHPVHSPRRYLHRAVRIGRAGHHYISTSFDEMPETAIGTEPRTDIVLEVTPRGLFGAKQASGGQEEGEAAGSRRYKVVSVDLSENLPSQIIDADRHGIELCGVRGVSELAAFLPAARAAGIALDLVAIPEGREMEFAPLCASHAVRCVALVPGTHVVGRIVEALAKGTEITIDAPSIQPAAVETGRLPGGIDVLAIEDNTVNRMVIEQILESLGVNSIVVADGREALARLSTARPQILLVDASMPDMSVAEFMRRLSLQTDELSRPPVIGMISTELGDQRLACAQAGLAAVIVKPLSPEVIDVTLRTHLFREKPTFERAPRSVA